jgi:2-methylcitrate dehydratase
MLCETFAEWALAQKWDNLSAEAQTFARRLMIDTLGCAIAGRDVPAAIKSAKVAASSLGGPGVATGLTSGTKLPVMGAILDSGAAIRALDLNDIYWGRASGGHPSDIFAAAFAVGEATNASVGDMLTAVAVGYEMFIRLADSLAFKRHYDHTTASCMGAAVIAGYLKKLDVERFANGLAIAFASSPRMSIMRRGAVSEVKAPAPALAEISGVLGIDLAEATLTGPVKAVDVADYGVPMMFNAGMGIEGLMPVQGGRLRILDVAIKRYPCIGTGQTTAATGVALHNKIGGRIERIRKVHLRTQDDDVSRSQISADFRHPDTREWADHSFWALFGMSLMDGKLSPGQFAAARWKDKDVQDLLNRTTMAADLTVNEPGRLSANATATLDDGSVVEVDTPYAPGHPRNPLDEAGVLVKFHECVDPMLGEAKADKIVAAWKKADAKTPVRDIIALCF